MGFKNNILNTDELLSKFLKEHPMLTNSKATIVVDEIMECFDSTTGKNIVYETPKIQITVTYPFIFDKRLIPNSFEGFEVLSVMKGSYPIEFPSENEALPLDEWFAPERYISFVKNNLDLIKNELNNYSLTNDEALDALTGGIKKHIEWCKETRKNIDSKTQNKQNEILD